MSLSTISSGENPYDLRPIAENILENVLSRRVDSKPSVIVMGEVHDQPSHRLLMQAVMQACLDRGLKVAFHLEYDHNLLARVARTRVGLDIKDHQAVALTQRDVNGELLLKATMCYEPFRYAPKVAHNVLAFCHDHKVSAAFTDAAKTKYVEAGRARFLDTKDPSTKHLVDEFAGDIPASRRDEIDIESSKGMELRNIMMAEKSVEAINHHDADVVIHHCGREHVFGDTESGFSFPSSLGAAFSSRGFPVTCVFPDTQFSQDRIPEEAAENEKINGLIVEGLSYISGDSTPDSQHDAMRVLSAESGDLLSLYNVESLAAERKWRTDVRVGLEKISKKLPQPK